MNGEPPSTADKSILQSLLRRLKVGRGSDTAPQAIIDGLMEERDEADVNLGEDEKILLHNILELREKVIEDVMVPRADIVAIDAGSSFTEVIATLAREGHSRMPVFRETLDDALGMIHIKDILAWHGREAEFSLGQVLRKVLFVAPSMHVLELLLEMRVKRIHMALVVDEYGGVDGLVTIEDLVEEIVGDIEDEHDEEEEPELAERPDGSIDADARVTLETLEGRFGSVFSEEEREDVDTLGGLIFSLAGRVPIRGELIAHSSGLEFMVLDADPRRVRRLRIRRLIVDAPAVT